MGGRGGRWTPGCVRKGGVECSSVYQVIPLRGPSTFRAGDEWGILLSFSCSEL